MIELDAWNIRERDQWGESAAQRALGEEPGRWHWVYGGTCFRLSQRAETAGGRPVILSRGYVMTRGGLDALRDQIWAEASRHGLGRAADVLIVADGAVWIWNLADDRFPQARQRLDAYHAKQHLWAVADALHGAGTPTARAWIAPLLAKLDQSGAPQVIADLREALTSLDATRRESCNAKSTIWTATATGWITPLANNAANPSAAARWNRPAANTNAASSGRANFGPKPATRR